MCMLNVMSEIFRDRVIVRCRGRLVAGQEAWRLYNEVISQPTRRFLVLDLAEV
jgi:hypothetical protein